ncbi:reticulocalbin-2 [Contarinia nasturtii]|uniref:reticulocalbin-2 n=1 Tax=Contarinia nasturtii TaxID=265458 RepID=UPI0012D3A8A0|nr:reticulocalbin-2 [Contarinia nasturtii]
MLMETKLSIVHLLLTTLILACFYAEIEAATTHKHGHHQGERLEDGAYRPRDLDHHGADGEHMTEFDHEAMLGSVKEAEEFHQLSPEESKQRLKLLVTSKIDTNKDGFVDKHELKAHILRSFKSLSEEESNDRFDEVDENNDEVVTWTEYLKEMYDMDSEDDPGVKVPVGLESENKLLIADDKQVFEAADLNKDGQLNREEFVLFISPEEHPVMLPIILNQTLRDKDTDKDGIISFQEYLGESARDHDKAWLIAEKERFDSEHDKDGDGLLNENEILSWIVPSNDDVATDEVNHLFAAADGDQDDRLNYDEIIDNHDLFVGSEATDYGDHLQNIDKFRDEL